MHSIQRQFVEITTGSEAQAHEIGTRLQAAWEAGVPALERLFDRMAGGGVLRIDRLELDLGILQGRDWLETFFQRLGAAFERSLGQGDRGGAGAADTPGVVIAADGLTWSSRGGSDREALVHYLRHGRLPWWSSIETGRGWLARTVAGLAPEARRGLGRIAAVEPAALARLVWQLPTPEVAELTAGLVPAALQTTLAALAEALVGTVAGPAAKRRLREAIWRAALKEAGSAPAAEAPARLARAWAAALAAADRDAPQTVLSDRALLSALPEPWRRAFLGALATTAAVPGTDARRPPRAAGSERIAKNRPARSPADADGSAARPRAPPSFPAKDLRDAADATPERRPSLPGLEPDETVHVTGAGAVLMHPFLPELFTRSGLWAEGAFVEPERRHLAVRLLGYLTFGDAEADEVDLLLARTMCAMDWEVPLLPDPPEAEALAAADALLDAVLRHWTALRSGSPDWLREQFFLRDGHLKTNNDGWMLTVETRAQDVLLGRLPWGYGVVMLPWLPAPITVRWRD